MNMEHVIKVDWQIKRITKVNNDGSIMIKNGMQRDSRIIPQGKRKAKEIYTCFYTGQIQSCPVVLA
ncbi:hypothetical protein JZU68_02200 [bacterium]|nr:hypothetical protein [bacterium]